MAEEENVSVKPERRSEIPGDPCTRRSARFSIYGYWLINRLFGYTDGPAVLALGERSRWTKAS